jgi:hypothetical protein
MPTPSVKSRAGSDSDSIRCSFVLPHSNRPADRRFGSSGRSQGHGRSSSGGTILYTGVSGDVGGPICDRFGRNYWQLNTVDDEGGFNCYSMIHVDEQLIVNNDRKPF